MIFYPPDAIKPFNQAKEYWSYWHVYMYLQLHLFKRPLDLPKDGDCVKKAIFTKTRHERCSLQQQPIQSGKGCFVIWMDSACTRIRYIEFYKNITAVLQL